MKAAKPAARKKTGDSLFLSILKSEGLPIPVMEHRFHPTRMWRFDYAWPDRRVALEVEGGIFRKKGAHNTPIAMMEDMEKYNAAAALGWRVLRVIPSEPTQVAGRPYLRSGYCIGLLKDVFSQV